MLSDREKWTVGPIMTEREEIDKKRKKVRSLHNTPANNNFNRPNQKPTQEEPDANKLSNFHNRAFVHGSKFTVFFCFRILVKCCLILQIKASVESKRSWFLDCSILKFYVI